MNLSYATKTQLSKSQFTSSANSQSLSLSSTQFQSQMTQQHKIQNSQNGVKPHYQKPKKRPLAQMYYTQDLEEFKYPTNSAFTPLNVFEKPQVIQLDQQMQLIQARFTNAQPINLTFDNFETKSRLQHPNVLNITTDNLNLVEDFYDPRIDNPDHLTTNPSIKESDDPILTYIIQTNDFRLYKPPPFHYESKPFIDQQTTLLFDDLKNCQMGIATLKDDISQRYEDVFTTNLNNFFDIYSGAKHSYFTNLSTLKQQELIDETDEFFEFAVLEEQVNERPLSRQGSVSTLSLSKKASMLRIESLEKSWKESVQRDEIVGKMKFLMRGENEDWRSYQGLDLVKKVKNLIRE